MAIAFALAAIILYFTKMPKLQIEDEADTTMKVLKSPLHFIMGIIIVLIFIYGYTAITDYLSGSKNFLFLDTRITPDSAMIKLSWSPNLFSKMIFSGVVTK